MLCSQTSTKMDAIDECSHAECNKLTDEESEKMKPNNCMRYIRTVALILSLSAYVSSKHLYI